MGAPRRSGVREEAEEPGLEDGDQVPEAVGLGDERAVGDLEGGLGVGSLRAGAVGGEAVEMTALRRGVVVVGEWVLRVIGVGLGLWFGFEIIFVVQLVLGFEVRVGDGIVIGVVWGRLEEGSVKESFGRGPRMGDGAVGKGWREARCRCHCGQLRETGLERGRSERNRTEGNEERGCPAGSFLDDA